MFVVRCLTYIYCYIKTEPMEYVTMGFWILTWHDIGTWPDWYIYIYIFFHIEAQRAFFIKFIQSENISTVIMVTLKLRIFLQTIIAYFLGRLLPYPGLRWCSPRWRCGWGCWCASPPRSPIPGHRCKRYEIEDTVREAALKMAAWSSLP